MMILVWILLASAVSFFCFFMILIRCIFNGDPDAEIKEKGQTHEMSIEDPIYTHHDQIAAVERRKHILESVIEERFVFNGTDNRKSSYQFNSMSLKFKSIYSSKDKQLIPAYTTVVDGGNEEISSTYRDPNDNKDEIEVENESARSFNDGSSISSNGSRSTKSIVKAKVCFICSKRYKTDETIYCSRNEKCNHSFHSRCMMRWLFDNDDCPICGELFLITPKTTCIGDSCTIIIGDNIRKDGSCLTKNSLLLPMGDEGGTVGIGNEEKMKGQDEQITEERLSNVKCKSTSVTKGTKMTQRTLDDWIEKTS